MYQTLVIDPLREMFLQLVSFIPTLVVAFAILVIGYLIAKVVSDLLLRLLKIVDFDKIADKIGVHHLFDKGGIRHKPSEILSILVYWVLVVMVLLITVKALGVPVGSAILDGILGYVPSVVSGVMALVIGFLLANIVSGGVYMISAYIEIPHAEILGRFSKWAIVIYALVIFLKEIGFGFLFLGLHAHILFGGIVFAAGLAFGLAGKDLAGKYLEVMKSKK